MAMRRFLFGVTIAACVAASAQAQILGDIRGLIGSRATPVLFMGQDNRVGTDEFAAAHAMRKVAVQSARAASGLVECGDAHGAGQLTLRNDIVTTAAHVLIDERGAQRAASCNFVAEVNGVWTSTPLDMASVVVGASRPYATKAVQDWAVVKLAKPLTGVQPYELASKISLNDEVEFVARGHSNWRDKHDLSFEACRLRNLTGEADDGRREFAFDCSTGDGASGGGAFVGRQLSAILVGWRSNDPSKRSSFSQRHYNFVVSVEGAFRQALLTAAGMQEAPNMDIANATQNKLGGGSTADLSNAKASNRSAAHP
jgi:hypothetical protein